ncbi:ubiquitin-conjugating enzyme E2 J2-like [Ylistrum balloti]|uniref:ubiquitin-conjugating enzyme E2 J2-like n=1 Tax=Ylistrum balloti TaxID=509963 RepID=UPI0029059D4F|nr:ubiquitin-conjugating enzyme E2 J2-like [Ylistrum balloti]
MASKRVNTTATGRLKQDYLRIMKDPVPYVKAIPLPSNILEWHYIVSGPEQSPYEGGIYHGKLIFPREFPFKPPSIYMITPNGRFKCNTRLCLSISDFHPDTWNPAWSVSTILTGLLSFMLEKSPTLGSIETSDATKRQLAAASGRFNLNDKIFTELFPDVAEGIKEEHRKREEELKESTNSRLVNNRSRSSNGNNNDPNQNNQGIMGSAVANIFVIIGLAAFAYTVKYVLRSVVE